MSPPRRRVGRGRSTGRSNASLGSPCGRGGHFRSRRLLKRSFNAGAASEKSSCMASPPTGDSVQTPLPLRPARPAPPAAPMNGALRGRSLVIGAGPAGLTAGYMFAKRRRARDRARGRGPGRRPRQDGGARRLPLRPRRPPLLHQGRGGRDAVARGARRRVPAAPADVADLLERPVPRLPAAGHRRDPQARPGRADARVALVHARVDASARATRRASRSGCRTASAGGCSSCSSAPTPRRSGACRPARSAPSGRRSGSRACRSGAPPRPRSSATATTSRA